MSDKQSDVPQDVQLVVNGLWHELVSALDRDSQEQVLARAILAAKAEEREACAHAAFDAAKAARCGVLRARQIDAAIRKRAP